MLYRTLRCSIKIGVPDSRISKSMILIWYRDSLDLATAFFSGPRAAFGRLQQVRDTAPNTSPRHGIRSNALPSRTVIPYSKNAQMSTLSQSTGAELGEVEDGYVDADTVSTPPTSAGELGEPKKAFEIEMSTWANVSTPSESSQGSAEQEMVNVQAGQKRTASGTVKIPSPGATGALKPAAVRVPDICSAC